MTDEMKPKARAKKDGTAGSGWRKGLVVSPAAVLAEAQFSRITRLLRGRMPWASIAQVMRDESGERFKVDTLQQYYMAELERRRLINKAKYNETRRKKAGAV